MTSSRISELAAIIQAKTTIVDDYLKSNNRPEPTFAENGPIDISIPQPEIEASRMAAVDAALELHDLLIGPMETVRPVVNATSLQFIYRFNVPARVPLGGEISYQELANQIGQEEHVVRRLLRFAISGHRIFQELKEGYVSHSAASRYLHEDSAAMDGLGTMYEEAWQAFAHTVEGLTEERNGKPRRAGWSVAHNTELPLFAYLGSNPERAQRFGGAMASFSKRPTLGVSHLVTGYDWSALGDATVVDVGGADGYTSMALAKQFPKLNFVVQDTPPSIEKFKNSSPPELKERVTFASHDFFQPQPAKADVFLLRQILHDWSDEKCIDILKALVPGLKSGGRVIINDHLVLPPGQSPLHLERRMRDMDLIMMSLFNDRDYEADDWRRLFKAADSRYSNITIVHPPNSQLAVVEAVWTE